MSAAAVDKFGFCEKSFKDRHLASLQVEEADDSQDSLNQDQPASPLKMSRDDVLSMLGYRSEHVSKPILTSSSNQRSDLCHRCGKKVYQVERVDIGELYHRGCLKCFICGVQLSLKTFHRVATDDAKEVYCKTHTPRVEKSISQDSIGIRSAVAAQKKASEKVFKPYEKNTNKYDPEALEFQHARQIKQRQKVKRRSSLKTHADFEKYGVFEAQAALEKRQRQEEDELYRQIFEERQRLMRNLEEVLSKEKEHTVKELVSWFEKQGSSQQEKEEGIKKLEQYYSKQREDQIKRLLEGMAVEERAAVDRLIEKHSQEMLFLIEEKEREVCESLESQTELKVTRDANKFRSFTESSKKPLQPKEEEDIEEEDEMEKESMEILEEEEKDEHEKMEEKEPSDISEDEEDVEKSNLMLTGDEEQMKGSPEMDDDETLGYTDMDKSWYTNFVVASETPADIEIQKLKMVPKQRKDKVAVESKTTQHTPAAMTDEGTQTHIPVAKQRSTGQKPLGYQHLAKSPEVKKRGRTPVGPQFLITISTERIAKKKKVPTATLR